MNRAVCALETGFLIFLFKKTGSVRTQLSYTAKTQRLTYSQLSNNVTPM